jgi:transcriptional regulator with XRE-family HTH domain
MKLDHRKFRAAIAAVGLSQLRLAPLIGLSRSALERRLDHRSRWRATEIERLARVLGVAPDWLLENVAEIVDGVLGAPDDSGLPICRAHRPAPGREADGRCSSCERAPCAHAPGADDPEDGGAP